MTNLVTRATEAPAPGKAGPDRQEGGAEMTTTRERRAQRIAQAVRTRREQLALTMTEAARRAELSWPTWQRVESGEQDTFKGPTIKGISKALQWPEDWLIKLRSGQGIDELAAMPRHQPVLRDLAHGLVDKLGDEQLSELILYFAGPTEPRGASNVHSLPMVAGKGQ